MSIFNFTTALDWDGVRKVGQASILFIHLIYLITDSPGRGCNKRKCLNWDSADSASYSENTSTITVLIWLCFSPVAGELPLLVPLATFCHLFQKKPTSLATLRASLAAVNSRLYFLSTGICISNRPFLWPLPWLCSQRHKSLRLVQAQSAAGIPWHPGGCFPLSPP